MKLADHEGVGSRWSVLICDQAPLQPLLTHAKTTVPGDARDSASAAASERRPVPLAEALQAVREQTQVLTLLARAWPDELRDCPAHRRHAYGRAILFESQEHGIGSFRHKAWYCRGKLARKSLPVGEHWRT